MLLGESKIIDLVIGAIIFGLGLLYLALQDRDMEKLTNTVNEALMEQENLYQQHSDININNISDEELCAIIMGYREYPIVIDGVIMLTDEMDSEKYLSMIKEGYYSKSYTYDSNNEMIQMIFKYADSV